MDWYELLCHAFLRHVTGSCKGPIALFQNQVNFFFRRGLKVAWARIGRTNFIMAASG